MYLTLKTNKEISLSHLISCLSVIKCWMSQSFLKLNENESEVIRADPRESLPILRQILGRLLAKVKQTERNMSADFHSRLSPDRSCAAIFLF